MLRQNSMLVQWISHNPFPFNYNGNVEGLHFNVQLQSGGVATILQVRKRLGFQICWWSNVFATEVNDYPRFWSIVTRSRPIIHSLHYLIPLYIHIGTLEGLSTSLRPESYSAMSDGDMAKMFSAVKSSQIKVGFLGFWMSITWAPYIVCSTWVEKIVVLPPLLTN